MDAFARLPSGERRPYFDEAAARLGIASGLLEKDFWVCWTLKRMFAIPDIGNHLTFKGGTSLSKVFNVIRRFSEDIDVAIERDYLGFDGDKDPEAANSNKERQRRVQGLKEACQSKIADYLQPQLQAAFANSLPAGTQWSLEADPSDSDRQTLLYEYPREVNLDAAGYLRPVVKIELGARSDHFPVDQASIQPYLIEAFPGLLADPITQVRVLGGERTFWEKACILHRLAHLPDEKPLAPRMSRHYYDLVLMIGSPIGDAALARIELLDRVAAFKQVYFPATWARYEIARPGTLRLIPGARVISELRRDYSDMTPMFFGQAPSFDEIIEVIHQFESRVNGVGR